jgi:hypothetical protein
VRRAALALVLLSCGGCFSARGGVEGYHRRVVVDMTSQELRKAIGKPKEVLPIPGQGEARDLPVEQWRYWWSYRTGKMLTIFFTLGIAALWTYIKDYGSDVANAPHGRVRGVSEVDVPK